MALSKLPPLIMPLLCLGVLLGPTVALADGGTVRAMEQDGGLAISGFTSPPVLTAGEVDISVLIQDADSHTALLGAQVQITVTPRDHAYLAKRHAASDKLATNRLMKVCHLQLEPGWHDVEVAVADGDRHGRLQFSILVGQTPTKATSFWPWFTWPAVPIFLVVANLTYQRLKARGPAIINGSIVN